MVSGFARAIGAALITLLVGIAPMRAQRQADPGQFLVISDIHFDPFFDGALFPRLVAEPAEGWGEVLRDSRPAGFNPRGTDSNNALLQSNLDDARLRCHQPTFILYQVCRYDRATGAIQRRQRGAGVH